MSGPRLPPPPLPPARRCRRAAAQPLDCPTYRPLAFNGAEQVRVHGLPPRRRSQAVAENWAARARPRDAAECKERLQYEGRLRMCMAWGTRRRLGALFFRHLLHCALPPALHRTAAQGERVRRWLIVIEHVYRGINQRHPKQSWWVRQRRKQRAAPAALLFRAAPRRRRARPGQARPSLAQARPSGDALEERSQVLHGHAPAAPLQRLRNHAALALLQRQHLVLNRVCSVSGGWVVVVVKGGCAQ